MPSSIYWPLTAQELPYASRGGYRYQMRSPVLRTRFSLLDRARRIYSDAPAQAQVQWSMLPAQWASMVAFYRDDLRGGVEWFWLPVIVAGAAVLREVRFIGEPQYSLMPPDNGMVSASILLRSGSISQAGVIAFELAALEVPETAGTITVYAVRLGGAVGTVGASYTTTPGSAVASGDYTTTAGALSWASGDAAKKPISIPIINDSLTETLEAFTVDLSAATGGAALVAPLSMRISIRSEDPPLDVGSLGFIVYAYAVAPGSTVTITVRRSNGADGAASVQYATANGTGLAGTDYTATSGALNWTDGDSADKTFTVTVATVGGEDEDKTFALLLTDATGAALGLASEATVTVRYAVLPAPAAPIGLLEYGVARFAVHSYAVSPLIGTLNLSVMRTGGADGAVSVDYATVPVTALAGDDYTAATGTLTWADGNSDLKTISVPIIDNDDGTDKTLTVRLSNPLDGIELSEPGAASITVRYAVLEAEAPTVVSAYGAAGFTVYAYAVSPDIGTLDLAVSRTGGSDGDVSVDYQTVPGTATAGTDYTSTTGTLNWTDGDAADKTISVPIIDAGQTDDVGLTVMLSDPAGGLELGEIQESSITIRYSLLELPAAVVELDDCGAVSFDVYSYAVRPDVGTASINVVRLGSTSGTLTAQYRTLPGTALAGVDYTTTTGTLEWLDGDGDPQTISVPIIEVIGEDEDRTLQVELFGVVCSHDEPPSEAGTIEFTAAEYEISTALDVEEVLAALVTRHSGSVGAVSVQLRIADTSTAAQLQINCPYLSSTFDELSWTQCGVWDFNPYYTASSEFLPVDGVAVYSATGATVSGGVTTVVEFTGLPSRTIVDTDGITWGVVLDGAGYEALTFDSVVMTHGAVSTPTYGVQYAPDQAAPNAGESTDDPDVCAAAGFAGLNSSGTWSLAITPSVGLPDGTVFAGTLVLNLAGPEDFHPGAWADGESGGAYDKGPSYIITSASTIGSEIHLELFNPTGGAVLGAQDTCVVRIVLP